MDEKKQNENEHLTVSGGLNGIFELVFTIKSKSEKQKQKKNTCLQIAD